MRKLLWLVAAAVIAVVVALALPGLVSAYGLQAGQNVTLPKGETKAGTYYALGQTVTIDGDVDGDLICAGSTVSVNGAVHGDVICAGQLVSVNGPVDGSVRIAAQSVTLAGTVGRNVTVAAQAMSLGSAARVAGDLGVFAETASLNGTVEKDVYGAMRTLSLGAPVGPVNVHVDQLVVGPTAQVQGNLTYTSDQTADVDQARVTGEIQHRTPVVSREQRQDEAARVGFALRLYWMIAGLLAGLVLVLLVPRLVNRVSRVMLERPGASLGWGLIITLLGPPLVVMLFISVLGIPLAVLVLALWLVALATAGIFAGITVGRWLLARADWRKESLALAAVFGIPLCVIFFSIPALGVLAWLLAMMWAVGGMAITAKSAR